VTFVHSIIISALILCPALAYPAVAEERQAAAGEFAAGALLFADDGVVSEGFVGGAARLRPRIPDAGIVSSGTFASADGAFTAGGGVRALAGRRLIVGAEARVGWELHIRVNGFIDVRLGE
jgi:hypothetical protein